jgi:hypothetical protein
MGGPALSTLECIGRVQVLVGFGAWFEAFGLVVCGGWNYFHVR